MKWDPSEYGGIRDIRIPGTANAIWKPDVLLYNRSVIIGHFLTMDINDMAIVYL